MEVIKDNILDVCRKLACINKVSHAYGCAGVLPEHFFEFSVYQIDRTDKAYYLRGLTGVFSYFFVA